MYSTTIWSICLIERFSETVCRNFDVPTVDCFATRINAHLPIFYSWTPEPRALVVDYFSVGWGNLGLLYVYILPFQPNGPSIVKSLPRQSASCNNLPKVGGPTLVASVDADATTDCVAAGGLLTPCCDRPRSQTQTDNICWIDKAMVSLAGQGLSHQHQTYRLSITQTVY